MVSHQPFARKGLRRAPGGCMIIKKMHFGRILDMNYRKLGRTGMMVSEIGMGVEGLLEQPFETVNAYFDEMQRLGVNILDMYASEPDMRANVGRALKGRRDQFILQGHIGSIWKDGQYKRTRDIGEVRDGFEELLRLLQTDYIDIGMIHYVDSLDDWRVIAEGEVLRQAAEWKKQGVIRAIGLSSHNPQAALAAV